ncbi:BglG family transcription antiterminator [Peribacillus deserti]|uniref:Uncharacterized protein n=1 Tax=Peribacillus deserti TaxID=673318 RepID=A0A2N5M1C7_9BACI|nr:BglG family transcription antiterminator [Peribacillus deserti]PLT28167.1 hypothetical protein CUU66_19675 [Peribacillus deserti]
MNTRQKQIMHLLSEKKDKEFITINEIAKVLNCSEKTVRNDFKQIDDWLKKDFQATIIRKPNVGVRIDIPKDEKKRLFSLMQDGKRNNDGNDINRKIEILSWLLKDDKTLSLLDLSERFFVSKHVIKQDLEEMESWLELFDLSIESRKKVGIRLIGDEKHKRAALSRIHHLGKDGKLTNLYESWFVNYEIDNVKQRIKKIENELNKDFTKESLNNLIFHLLIIVKRIKAKQIISMTKHDLENLKSKKDYEVVKKHLNELERTFVMRFPEEEIGYFLLHILGSKEKNTSIPKHGDLPPKMISFLTALIKKMSYRTNVEHEKDEQLFQNLAIHMQSAFERIEHGLYYRNPLLNDIKKTYPYMFDTLFHVTKEIEGLVGFGFPEDEIGYLVLHFEASKERLNKIDGKNKRAVVVCSMGIGMSQLLTTKMERKFHSLDIINCVAAEDLDESIKENRPDFIISTIPLNGIDLPVVTVSPLLPKEEEEKIKTFISNLEAIQVSKFAALKKYVDDDLILLKNEVEEPGGILESLCKLLEEKGHVNKKYIFDVHEREEIAPTTIGGEIAIPHGHPKNVLKQGVAMAVLKKPVLWKREYVSVVFMLAIKETKGEDIKHLFEEISFLGENKEIVERWKALDSKDGIFRNMR